MTIRFPQQNSWKQANIGDRFGDIWSSYNLDLSSRYGNLRVHPRMLLNVATADLANLTAPACAIRAWGTDDIWVIAKQRMWVISNGGPNTAFAQDAASGTPTTLSSDNADMEVMNTALYVSGSASTNVYKLTGAGIWSAIASAKLNSTSTGAPEVLCYFRALNKLYILDDAGAGIGSISSADAVVLASSGSPYSLNDIVGGITNQTGEYLNCMVSNSRRLWIGTINQTDGQCHILAWDGAQAGGVNESYIIDAQGILGMIVIDDVPWAFDTHGRLLSFNGATFTEVAHLPFEIDMPPLANLTATKRLMHYNGITTVGGKINLLLNTTLYNANANVRENIPSGVWEYSKEAGLYHKSSVGHTKAAGAIVDYGQEKLSSVGAIAEIGTDYYGGLAASGINGTFMCSADYYTTATVTTTGIFYDDSNDTLQKAGYFVIPKVLSSQVRDMVKEAVLRFRKHRSANDKIVVKYRTTEDDPVEATITYTSTTTFTVPTSPFTTAPAAGDEIEILQGVGAGRTAHISGTPTSGGGNYTITVDETITGATTQTAKARFQTWKKLGSYNAQTDDIFEVPISDNSVWCQIKVWLLWTGVNEIYDLTVGSSANQPIK